MFVPRGSSPRLNAISGCLENRTRKKAIWFSFSVAYSAILVWWEEQGCRLPSQSTYQVQGQVMSSVWQWNCGQRGLHRQRKASLLERACAPWFWSELASLKSLPSDREWISTLPTDRRIWQNSKLWNSEPRRATTKESCWTSLHGVLKQLEEGIIFNKLEAFQRRQKWAFFEKFANASNAKKGRKWPF